MKKLTRERFTNNDLNHLNRTLDRLDIKMMNKLFRREGIFIDDIEGIYSGKSEKAIERLKKKFPERFVSLTFNIKADKYKNHTIDFTIVTHTFEKLRCLYYVLLDEYTNWDGYHVLMFVI